MRTRVALLVLFAAASMAVVAGCHRSPSADVVATVNGKELMRAELDRNYKASLGDAPQKLSQEEADIRRLTILHQMITDEILEQRAAKLNLAASDEDVNAKITELKAPYTQEEFDNQLKQRDMTLDDLKRNIRRSLTKDKLINKEIESESTSPTPKSPPTTQPTRRSSISSNPSITWRKSPSPARPRSRPATCRTARPPTTPTPKRRSRSCTTVSKAARISAPWP